MDRIKCHILPYNFFGRRTVNVTYKKAVSPTLYNSPQCLPPQSSFAMHFIFLVTAHHSKGHHLLWTQISPQFSVPKRAAQGLRDKTSMQHANTLKQRLEKAMDERDWLKLGGKKRWKRLKSWDKCVQKKEKNHLLWSCHCRSCLPYRHQILSEGKSQSRYSPVPSLPTAQSNQDTPTIWVLSSNQI